MKKREKKKDLCRKVQEGVWVVLTLVTLIDWLGVLNASSIPHVLLAAVHRMVVIHLRVLEI